MRFLNVRPSEVFNVDLVTSFLRIFSLGASVERELEADTLLLLQYQVIPHEPPYKVILLVYPLLHN
jgi:hypothetical protein